MDIQRECVFLVVHTWMDAPHQYVIQHQAIHNHHHHHHTQGSLAALGTTPTSTTNPRPPPPVAQIHAPTVDNTPAPTRTLLHTKSTSSSSFKLTNTPGVTTTSVTAGGAGLTAGGGGNVPPAAAAASGVSPWLLATGVSAVLQAPEYEPDGIGVEPMLQWYMEHVHLPLLLRRRISRVCVVFFFGVLFLGALGALPHVERYVCCM